MRQNPQMHQNQEDLNSNQKPRIEQEFFEKAGSPINHHHERVEERHSDEAHRVMQEEHYY